MAHAIIEVNVETEHDETEAFQSDMHETKTNHAHGSEIEEAEGSRYGRPFEAGQRP